MELRSLAANHGDRNVASSTMGHILPPRNAYASISSGHVLCWANRPKLNSNATVSTSQNRPISNHWREANDPYQGAAAKATRKMQTERVVPLAIRPAKLPNAGISAVSLRAPFRMASTSMADQSAADFSQTDIVMFPLAPNVSSEPRVNAHAFIASNSTALLCVFV